MSSASTTKPPSLLDDHRVFSHCSVPVYFDAAFLIMLDQRTLSNVSAIPWPRPMHIVARPRRMGVGLSVICAACVGLLLPADSSSGELLARRKLGYDNVLLALASGAAGALSLTTRLPNALTGDVMVAVALLPPATTFGYMIGIGELRLAVGAATLLV